MVKAKKSAKNKQQIKNVTVGKNKLDNEDHDENHSQRTSRSHFHLT